MRGPRPSTDRGGKGFDAANSCPGSEIERCVVGGFNHAHAVYRTIVGDRKFDCHSSFFHDGWGRDLREELMPLVVNVRKHVQEDIRADVNTLGIAETFDSDLAIGAGVRLVMVWGDGGCAECWFLFSG